jgi:hypothetical protein
MPYGGKPNRSASASGDASCNPCVDEPYQSTARWLARRSVVVTTDTAAIVLGLRECYANPGGADPHIKIRRRGKSNFTLRYDVFDTDTDGRARFILDSRVHSLPSGRYEAAIFQGCEYCSSFELVVPGHCAIGETNIEQVPVSTPIIHNGNIEGNCVYPENIVNFSSALTAVVEPGTNILPLPADAKTLLCGAVLTAPVQLVLYDGVKSEVVDFAVCEGGVPLFTRGAGTSTPSRFPKGATLTFSWTPTNVSRACDSCP